MTTPLYRSRPGGFDIQPASMPEARRITDFLYMSEGLSTSYLVVTDEGRVVVNTGMGFEAPVHKRNYDAVDTGPVERGSGERYEGDTVGMVKGDALVLKHKNDKAVHSYNLAIGESAEGLRKQLERALSRP